MSKGVLQMKKIFKVVTVVLSILLILQLVIFLTARYGWKLFGFDMCERPNSLLIETVYVTDENIHIVGNTSNSSTAYVGHTYEIKDDILYVGIKQNFLFGFKNRIGGYSFTIEDDLENIEAVYLKNNKDEEKCIWSVEEDKKYMEKISRVRLYETVSFSDDEEKEQQNELAYVTVYTGNVVCEKMKEKMASAEFAYADEALLDRIQHPTFSDEIYFSKGGGYLGVAELDKNYI